MRASDKVRQVSPRLFEAPPVTVVTAASGPGSMSRLLRWGWGRRVEWALLSCAYLVCAVAAQIWPQRWVVVAVGIFVVLLVIPRTRRWLVGLLALRRRGRQFMRAARHVGLANHNDRVPVPVSMWAVPAGEVFYVRLAKGSHAGELEDHAEALAAVLEAREVKVRRDASNARYASVTVVRKDPLAGRGALGWPWLSVDRCCLWDPIPVGVDEYGEVASVSLVERNVLVGGEPGAGKSVALSLLVAVAALDPDVRLSLFDGKLVELATWAPLAEHVVGPDLEAAIVALRELRDDMECRYRYLLSLRRRKLSREEASRFPLRLVVVDELALFTAGGERKASVECSGLMRDLVARGRAAGIIVLAATQKPGSDIVPTALRDLFGMRWAMRCSTPQASDTILGQGWASQGYSASRIDAGQRGVGYLLAEGGVPTRLKSYYLSDEDLEALAVRAGALRGVAVGPVAVGPIQSITAAVEAVVADG